MLAEAGKRPRLRQRPRLPPRQVQLMKGHPASGGEEQPARPLDAADPEAPDHRELSQFPSAESARKDQGRDGGDESESVYLP